MYELDFMTCLTVVIIQKVVLAKEAGILYAAVAMVLGTLKNILHYLRFTFL